MSQIWDFLRWISYFDILKNSTNILGVFWLIALTIFGYVRFKKHFEQNGYFPKPIGARRKFWFIIPLLFSFLWGFLMQLLIDDGIATPISLLFGGWSLMGNDPFTLSKLWAHKSDVYIGIAVLLILFTWFGIWRFFHFTKKSFFWLSLLVILTIIAASQNIINFRVFQGDAHVWVFWLTYPEGRILSGFFSASLLKKAEPQK